MSSDISYREKLTIQNIFKFIVVLVVIVVILVFLKLSIDSQKSDWAGYTFGLVFALLVLAFKDSRDMLMKILSSTTKTAIPKNATPHNERTEKTESDSHNVTATVENRKTHLVIGLTPIHREEHNLKFGILFNREMKLEEVPEIKFSDEHLTQKGVVSFSLPYEFVEYKRRRYVPVRLDKPASVQVRDALEFWVSKDKNPKLRVISIIQLQPDGNHTEIPIQKR